ncbi:MAG TPA: hypothetical protein VFZ84_21860 [Burkholderiales bacterium]
MNCSAAPKTTKPITSSPNARVGMPMTLSLLAKWNEAVPPRSRGRPEIGPGIWPANTGYSETTVTTANTAVPPARRVASSSISQPAHATHTASTGALYSQPSVTMRLAFRAK